MGISHFHKRVVINICKEIRAQVTTKSQEHSNVLLIKLKDFFFSQFMMFDHNAELNVKFLKLFNLAYGKTAHCFNFDLNAQFLNYSLA